MFKQLKNNERGMVFVMVLMVIVVMTVLAISIVSMNVSQVMIAEDQTKRIQAELLALGAMAYKYDGGSQNSYTETLGNSVFTVTINIENTTTGIFSSTKNMDIHVYQ